MPVQVNRTDFRLDKIIGVAEALIGTDAGGDAFSVRRASGTEASDLSELILNWAAVPVGGNARQWFVYQAIEAQDVSGSAFYAALDGAFPVEVNLQIGGTAVEIASLEAPAPKDRRRATFAGLNGVRDLPTIEADGDALFANSRLGAGAEPFDLVEFDLVLGVGLTVVAGLIVHVTEDVPVLGINAANPAVASITVTDDGGVNLQLGTTRAIWAQEVDSSVVPLESPDGIKADEVMFEETVSWITRTEISGSSVIIVGDKKYGLVSVTPLNRGRFYSVTATRRYTGVAL